MDSKKNESHIGGKDLFDGTELTSEQKIAAAEAAMAAARAEAAEGGRIAGEARTAGEERRRIADIAKGDLAEPGRTANEEVGYLRELHPGTLVDIEDAKRAQAAAAEAARGELERLKRDERIKAQEVVNKRGFPPVKEALKEALGGAHLTPGERNIEASKANTAREEEWKRVIARGRDGEPVEPPMKTADTVPEARERLKEIIAERDETTT